MIALPSFASRLALAALGLAIAAPAWCIDTTADQAGPPVPHSLPATDMREIGGALPQGAHWQAVIPSKWNGTLLVWSHGYTLTIEPPLPAPPEYREALLAKGFGLLASDYGAGGWALAEAVPAQRAAIDAFVASVGRLHGESGHDRAC